MGDTEAPDYVLSNTGVREGAFSFQLGKQGYKQGFEFYYSYFKTKIAILKSAHIGNTDDLIDAINNAEPNYIAPFTYAIGKPYQDVTHHLGKINYYRRFEGLGKWFVQYDFQRNHRLEFDTRIGDNRDRPSIDLQLDTHTWRTYLQWKTSENFALKTGVNAGYQDNFADPSTGVKRLIPDYNKYDFGFFVTSEYYWKPNTTIDAAFRYDFNRIDAKKFYSKSRWDERGYQEDFGDDIIGESGSRWLVNPVLDFHNFSFSAGLSHIWEDGKSFRFNYTLAQRAPNPSELFSDGLHHSAARIELGDLRMQQETSHKLGLSFAKTHGALQYELSPFINLIDNFILLEPTATQLSLAGAFPVWTYRQTSAHLFGVDLNASYDWTDQWQSKHAFSLVKGTDTDKDIPLINIPPVRFNNGIIYQIPQWNVLQ
jgi:iron complex outermembrane receptor protein